MKWYLIKGGLIIFPLFIAMGLIANLIGLLSFFIFSKSNKYINDFLKISIWISFFIGFIGFSYMGMFYASYTLTLTPYMVKWLAIIIVLSFILVIVYYSSKEYKSLTRKTIAFNYGHFQFHPRNNPYINHSQIVNQSVFQACPMLLISFIFFLFFNGLADTLSFGLNSFLLSLIK